MIIITGGAGFIGSALLWKLNTLDVRDVVIVDALGKSTKWKNLVGKDFTDIIHKNDFLKLIEEDRLRNIDAVIHLGACTSTTEEDADYLLQNNYDYTCALAEWAVARNVRFIYASSAAVYGDGELGFSDIEEDELKFRPLNMYGYSKQLVDLWHIRERLLRKVAGVRFFNVYGPNEYHKDSMASMVYKSYQQLKNTGTIKLFKSYHPEYKDGEQLRDFVYVKDCVDVIVWLMENRKVCGIYNLGTGKAQSWNQLATAVCSALGKEPSIEYIEMPDNVRKHYQYFTQADMTQLQDVGCEQEFLSLEDGVADYVKNYLEADVAFL